MPTRITTVITLAAGSVPLELRQLSPSSALESIPVLILGNAQDNIAGTFMIQEFFAKGLKDGAPWTFAVQPDVGHCCTSSAKALLWAWMASVVPMRNTLSGSLTPVKEGEGEAGSFHCARDGVIDANGYPDCAFTSAAAGAGYDTPTWLPDGLFLKSWQDWTHAK